MDKAEVIKNPWQKWMLEHSTDKPEDYMYRQYGRAEQNVICGTCLFFSGGLRGCRRYGGDIKATGNIWSKITSACGLWKGKPKKDKRKNNK